MSEKKSIFKMLSPSQLFVLGIGSAFFVLTSIGFFTLLAMQLSGSSAVTTTKNPGKSPTVQPSVPQPDNANITLAAVSEDDWYKGAKNAEITIVEYSDTECPFCKRFHVTMNQIIDEYGDKVKWVYRHAPLDSLHRKARRESMALECAGDLAGNDGFWDYTDKLFEITPSNDGLRDEQLFTIAEDVGLNKQQFTECLESERYAAEVQKDLDDATKAGLRGTPYSVLIAGDQKVPISGAQPYEQVAKVIDSFLE